MNVERNMKYKIKGILFFVILIGILILITGCGEEYDQSEKVLNEKKHDVIEYLNDKYNANYKERDIISVKPVPSERYGIFVHKYDNRNVRIV